VYPDNIMMQIDRRLFVAFKRKNSLKGMAAVPICQYLSPQLSQEGPKAVIVCQCLVGNNVVCKLGTGRLK
jgi:hypothetical protein